VKERPIIMGPDSVRAVLADRKTQTRRVLRREHVDDVHAWCRCDADGSWIGWAGQRAELTDYDLFTQRAYPDGGGVRCPYGVVGDRLWVREAFKTSEYHCTEEQQDEAHECGEHCKQTYVYYAATPRHGYRPVPDRAAITYLDESSPLTDWYTAGWKTPIFMPRWASRLTLEITDVRVQRLQDISDEDARAEGQGITWGGGCFHRSFAGGWDSINKKRGHGWDTNPWTWAVSFRRLPS